MTEQVIQGAGGWSTTVTPASGLSSFAPVSLIATALQGGASAVSALSQMSAGRVAKQNAEMQADMNFFSAGVTRKETALQATSADLEGSQDYIAGQVAANQLADRLRKTIGGQRVAFAASGVDASSGSAARIQAETDRQGQEAADQQRVTMELRRLQSIISASAIRRQGEYTAAGQEVAGYLKQSQGEAANAAGKVGALGSMMDFAAKAARRG